MKKYFWFFLIFDIFLAILIPIFLGINYYQNNKYDFAVIGGAEVSINNQEKLNKSLKWLNNNHIYKVVFLGNMVEYGTEENYEILINILNRYKKINFYYQKGTNENIGEVDLFDKYFTDYSDSFIEFANYNFYFYSNKSQIDGLKKAVANNEQTFVFSQLPADCYYLSECDVDLYNAISGHNNVTICYNKNYLSPLSKKAFFKDSYASICVGTISDTNAKYKTWQSSSCFGTLFKIKTDNVIFNNVNFSSDYIYSAQQYSLNYKTDEDGYNPYFSSSNYERFCQGNNIYFSIAMPKNIEYVSGYQIELYSTDKYLSTITFASDYLFGDLSNKQTFLMSAYDYGELKSFKIYIIDINDNISVDSLTIAYSISGIEI